MTSTMMKESIAVLAVERHSIPVRPSSRVDVVRHVNFNYTRSGLKWRDRMASIL
jgi:hypothetical protein